MVEVLTRAAQGWKGGGPQLQTSVRDLAFERRADARSLMFGWR